MARFMALRLSRRCVIPAALLSLTPGTGDGGAAVSGQADDGPSNRRRPADSVLQGQRPHTIPAVLIESELLSEPVLFVTGALAALVVAVSIFVRPWRGWLADAERRAVWLGSLAMLGAAWSLHAGFAPGLSLRFLLVTACTLLHGWALTILGATLVLAALSAIGIADWASFGPNLLCTAIVPALFAARLHEVVHRRLPRNYFIYFFVSAFLGSALAWILAALLRWLLLVLSGQPSTSGHVGQDYVAVLALMTFGEAFLNGMLIAAAVVFRPKWVMSFDDRAYLAKR